MRFLIPLFFLLCSCSNTTTMETMCLPDDDDSPEVINYIAGAVHMFCWNITEIRPKTIDWNPIKGSDCSLNETRYEVWVLCKDF